MRTVERGSGAPRVAVVGGIHGDEPAGEVIVDHLVDDLVVDHGTVQLVLANERALAARERYTDTDLNRAFPGDIESPQYETALAARLVDVLDGAEAVLAIHTSRSAPPPFAIFSELTDSVRRTVTGMPVEYALDSGSLRSTTLDSVVPHAVSLEAGHQGSQQAVDFGRAATEAFLRAHGVLRDEPPDFTEVTLVEGHEEVPKGGGTPTVNYRNFERMDVGSVFARDDEVVHEVERDGLVPVLASEDGYDDIFGIYGTVEGTVNPPADP
jgi:predicted deacylase